MRYTTHKPSSRLPRLIQSSPILSSYEKRLAVIPVRYKKFLSLLHGEIEEVYMKAPGFSNEYGSGEGCRLKKELYSLKQSLRAWFGGLLQQ